MKTPFIISMLFLTVLIGCKIREVPPPPPSSFFFALITPPQGLPIDFEADEGVGDYNASSGLLRLQASGLTNANDKIEITIKKVNLAVMGTYDIGPFDEGSTNVRAEFIDAYNEWSARSLSGSLTITAFEPSENGLGYWMSGFFSFEAAAQNEEIVSISNGEFQSSAILAE